MLGSKATRQQNKALARAQKLRSEGQFDEAVAALRDAQLFEEAAVWLSEENRFREAARILLIGLDVTAAGVERMDAPRRKRVMMAAVYFTKSDELPRAIDLYLALGETGRAEELSSRQRGGARHPNVDAGANVRRLLQAERFENDGESEKALQIYIQEKAWEQAGRVARSLGKSKLGADYYMLAGRPFDAAACWLDADDAERSMDCLVKVPRDDPKYRVACMHVSRVAFEYNLLSFEVDNFLGPFMESGAQDELEAQALYDIGELYTINDMYEGARDAYKGVVAYSPKFKDAALLLEAVEDSLRGSPAHLAKILDDKRRQRGAAPPIEAPAVATAQPDLAGVSRPGADSGSFDSPEPATLFSPGRIVAERYLIEDIIGRGGNAVVMRALDKEFGDTVALKVITPLANDDDMVMRFKRELRVTRQLTHPNIIRVHDGGIYEGRRYISMELLVGNTLDAWLGSPMPLKYGIGYLTQACAGLEHAHNAGIVHRDVKPGNLFLTNEGVIKVMDFGLARQSDTGSGSLTGKQIIGTPTYMAPEQINQRPTTPATDIYSLGIVAYEIFTGTVPFQHNELLRLLMMHVTDTPRLPSRHNPDIPKQLERIILKCLSKHPSERYQSADALSQHLEAVLAENVSPF